MNPKLKNALIQTAKVLFSAGIIFWLIQSGKLNFAVLKNLLTPTVVVVGLLLVSVNYFLTSERWRLLLRSQGVQGQSLPVFKLTMIGAFFNFSMPGGVGGDVVKAFYFTRDNPGSKVVAVTSILMDRILGLFSMTLMALLVMVFDFQHIVGIPVLQTLFWFILSLSIGFVVALALLFSPKIYDGQILKKIFNKLPLSEKILKVYESVHLYGRDGKRVLAVIILSLVAQVFSVLFLYVAGHYAGFEEIPFTTYLLVAPLGFMATAIPVSPAGVGVGQAAFYFLFNLYTGQQSELGPTTITAFQVCSFLLSLLGAFFYLRRKDHAEAKKLSELREA